MCYAENIAKTFHSSSTYLSYWPLLFFTKYVVGALVLVGNRPNPATLLAGMGKVYSFL